MGSTDDRQRAIDMAMSQIERLCGKGSIMRVGEDTPDIKVQVISTGCLSLDLALGIGGVPRGRIIEIYGPESSGTSLFVPGVARIGRVTTPISASSRRSW